MDSEDGALMKKISQTLDELTQEQIKTNGFLEELLVHIKEVIDGDAIVSVKQKEGRKLRDFR